MKKTTLLPVVLLLLFCSCSTTKHINSNPDNVIQTSHFNEKYSENNQNKVYQPSGKTLHCDNEIISQNLIVVPSLPNLTYNNIVYHQLDSNFTYTTVLTDTTKVNAPELIELNEANQSFTLGLTSFISLIAAMLFTIAGISIFSAIFFLAAIILGILGLRKGIFAKRIIKQNENIYSNSKKSTWGIMFSLAVFTFMLTFLIVFIYLMIAYAGF